MKPLRDREVVELLADEPELLAIADAIAATARPKRRRRFLIPTAALTAAVVAATAAFAATGDTPYWFFKGYAGTFGDRDTYGRASVELGRKTFVVNAYIYADGHQFTLALQQGSQVVAQVSSAESRLPFAAASYRTSDGQIWYGDAWPNVATIAVTDVAGRTVLTKTVAPARRPASFRLWVVAIPGSTAETVAGYDADDKLVARRWAGGIGRPLAVQ